MGIAREFSLPQSPIGGATPAFVRASGAILLPQVQPTPAPRSAAGWRTVPPRRAGGAAPPGSFRLLPKLAERLIQKQFRTRADGRVPQAPGRELPGRAA